MNEKLRFAGFCAVHAVLITASFVITVLLGLKAALILGTAFKAAGHTGLLPLLACTAVMIGIIVLLAWKWLLPYTNWAEPRLEFSGWKRLQS